MKRKLVSLFLCSVFLLWAAMAGAQTVQRIVPFGWTPPQTNVDNTPVTDLAGYKLYWGNASGGPYTLLDTITSPVLIPPTTEQTKSETINLPANVDVTKFFVMTAYDTATPPNESGYSNVVSQFFNLAPPPTPGAFSLLSMAGNNATFSWTQVIPTSPVDLSGWRIWQSGTSGGPWALLATVPYATTQPTYSFTQAITPTTGTLYWVIIAFDTAGNQSSYSGQLSYSFAPLKPPTSFRVIPAP